MSEIQNQCSINNRRKNEGREGGKREGNKGRKNGEGNKSKQIYIFFLYNTVYQLYLNFKNTFFFLEKNFLTFLICSIGCVTQKNKKGRNDWFTTTEAASLSPPVFCS